MSSAAGAAQYAISSAVAGSQGSSAGAAAALRNQHPPRAVQQPSQVAQASASHAEGLSSVPALGSPLSEWHENLSQPDLLAGPDTA